MRTRAPLVRTICDALGDCTNGSLRAGFFLDILDKGSAPTTRDKNSTSP